MTDLSQLEADLSGRIATAPDLATLEAIRVEALGKSGSISDTSPVARALVGFLWAAMTRVDTQGVAA